MKNDTKKEEKMRQLAKEKAIYIALQNDMALMRRDLEVFGVKKNGEEVSISKSETYEDLWKNTLNALEKNYSEVEAIDWKIKSDEYLNDLKRAQADFENYKRRQAESQKELKSFLIEQLVLDIIPVLDNFRSANGHIPEASKSEPWVVGIQYIEKQLEDVLVSNGMQTIEVNEGDMFDPNIHEAVSQITELRNEDHKVHEKNAEEIQDNQKQTVAKVLQKGYRLGEKIIRPAKVIVV